MKGKFAVRFGALGYLALLLLLPIALVVWRTFEHGLKPVIDTLTSPAAVHAFWLTMLMAAVAVPLNTLFGVACAYTLVRRRFRGRSVLSVIVDLPFAVSPVVLGLALYALYGRTGWLGPWLSEHGLQVIFSIPGMILATVFASLPFVVREVVPVLQEIGTDQEQASSTLGASGRQTFLRITLPAIRWGIAYGVVLTTARALGEFGAVSVVSGNLIGQTQTLPLYVENRYDNFDLSGAYTASFLLAAIAVIVLLLMTRLNRSKETK
ncbi:MAG TPA: sulfate ABC transporter permease subunit CysW [Mycobacteriales bacterium]